ncbi:MAG: hypothetical protein OEM85_01480 [Gammaproteobacteria bacterium]|nr:hypothetical protein [Gammaproteobacteria bacterium]MDH3372026.1 hypothetical protein [Gammaproteobacteria bacterium]MDH3410205.1 hypothetical protein [Gammaproteobacteria bacterium]
MKLSKYLLLGLILLGANLVWAGKPIQNIEDEVVPPKFDGSARTLEDVRTAIAEGCKGKGWRPVMDGETKITCSILVRGKHYAEVSIPFSVSNYSILYSNSRVLDYDAERQRIHKKYNGWVLNLNASIQRQFAL